MTNLADTQRERDSPLVVDSAIQYVPLPALRDYHIHRRHDYLEEGQCMHDVTNTRVWAHTQQLFLYVIGLLDTVAMALPLMSLEATVTDSSLTPLHSL